MKRNCRNAFLSTLLFCLAAGSAGVANPQTPEKANTQIEVKISPKTRVVNAGEELEVQVEIWNVGTQEVFIEKRVYSLSSHSPLTLRLELGPPLKPGKGFNGAADCADNPKEDFTSRLIGRWIPLPVGHFYGVVVRMDPDSFPQLQTPGRWRLRGDYKSDGDLSSSICVIHPTPLDPEEVARLPYKAWQGEEETNTVWINVLRPGSSFKIKK
jgi:hypothetical protein